MGGRQEEYRVGEYWLSKRRDGKSPEVWQIARYDSRTRSIVYRSTRKKGLDDAKAEIHSYVERERSKAPQRPEDAKVIPLLFTYWEEHGRSTVKPAQIASSLRQFIGFLMQDIAGLNVTVAELRPQVFVRFREWRMKPHAYSVPWAGETIKHASTGVKGESVQRNLDDIRAALTHHANNGRLPYAPKVPAVPRQLRSPPKDRVLSDEEMGAIVGYAMYDADLFRFVCIQIATLVRPEAAGKFDPRRQYDAKRQLIDLHHADAPRTKKHNPIVPAVPRFVPILEAWARDGATAVTSHKTRWRTMRRALRLGRDVEAKTIRHTVATRLRTMRVPAEEVETLLGHRVLKKTSAVYAKYDPDYLSEAAKALAIVWDDVMAAAMMWAAGHLRAKVGRGQTIILDRNLAEAQKSKA
jgi:integrase